MPDAVKEIGIELNSDQLLKLDQKKDVKKSRQPPLTQTKIFDFYDKQDQLKADRRKDNQESLDNEMIETQALKEDNPV